MIGKNANVHIVKNATHFVFDEEMDEFVTIVKEFIDEAEIKNK
eukprot:CAMPEP_0114601112 /NCGR_PEP_ID=MMETSP0125-20121206/23760_1 /TAXON_ID=485358 ORGANISM="Aristerostoma sp., Strain ATCC 50986" /NCGR_SAMPLE_ID=MMETSP0125 /ASSEMBLY_ACC=CAM_ASM_000245 /LENGTH=42 /DNA_ID= /DNA_START= /DNA_END= /DNA_ORIENTATION=